MSVTTDTTTVETKFDELINTIKQNICNCNYSFKCEPKILGKNNNIQPAHVNVEYSLAGGNLVVYDIASVSELYGYSMRPTIFTGNKMLLRQYKSKDQLKEGVIIYYKVGDKYRVHRIKGLYEDFLVVQGDNIVNEEQIKYNQILYIVVGVLYE